MAQDTDKIDLDMRMEEAGRKAEEIMRQKTETTLNGEVETDPSEQIIPNEVIEADEKAISSSTVPEPTLQTESDVTKSREEDKTPVVEGAPKAKTEETPPVTEPEPKTGEEEPDEEEKEIDKHNLRPDAHPKTKKVVSKLKEIAKNKHRGVKRALKEVAEWKTKFESVKALTPEIEKELEDNRNFRKSIDIENDPEFKTKYDQRLGNIESEAINVLTAENLPATNRLPKATADFIQANGGVLHFRSSSNYMPPGVKDAQQQLIQHADGTPFTHREFWDKHIAPALTPNQLDDINALSLESRQLNRERQNKINEAKANIPKWEQDRQQQTQLQQEDFANRVKKKAEEYVKTFGDIAMRKEYPANATKDQVALVDKHNSRLEKAEKRFQTNMGSISPETLTVMALNDSRVEYVLEDNQELKTKLEAETKRAEAAEKRLDDFKNHGKTSTKQSAPIKTNEKPKTQFNQDTETLMAARMREQGL